MKKSVLILIFLTFFGFNGFSQSPNQVSVYPNPASSSVHINFSNPVRHTVTVSISDILGNKIKIMEFIENEPIDIDLTPLQLHNGLYLVKIETGDQTYLKRLLVKS